MGKVYRLLFLSAISVGLFSCSDDEKLPKPVVGFTVSQQILEVNVPVTFNNTTTNASSYEWTFGDGQTSDDFSPTIFYDERGTYTVTLIAFTDDNQSEETSMDVVVGERQLMQIRINTLSFVNNTGGDWDEIDPDSTSFKFPDFWFILGPNDDPNFDFTVGSGIVADLSPNQLAIVFSSNAGGITTLTDETWSIIFLDFDGADVDNILNDDPSEVMSFIEFNPVQDADADLNGDGELELSQGLYSVDLVFKVE